MLLHTTTSLCRECLCALPAQVLARPDNTVWMRKTCPDHGAQEAQLSDDARWYERTRSELPAPAPPPGRREVELGCPYDCGPCEHHEQKVRLPVVTITSKCDLDCPICYVHNKNDDAFHMSNEEFARLLDHLHRNADGDLDLINFTGGEPTLHPRWLELMEMALDSGVHRVSICSHGIRLVKDESLVEQLATIGGRVALSFDTFHSDADFTINGARITDLKMRCLDLLEKHDVDTTLIPVMTKGVNDHEIGRIIQLMLDRPNIRHCEVHTVTYSGQGGESFDRNTRISIHEVLTRIEDTTDGLLRQSDFVPSPCAHPLCYQIAYLLLDPEGGPPVPYLRFLTRQEMIACLADHLYLEPSPTLERVFQDAINRLWSAGDQESERILRMLSALVRRMFPTGKSISRAEALRVGELASKAVYVHSHMDAETFDVDRAMQCCDSNCYADGKTVPICNTNVLFKGTEPRFNTAPRNWGARTGGRLTPLPQSDRLLPVIR